MNYTCIIVDDEKRARHILKSYITDISYLELKAEFRNAIEIFEYLKYNAIDVIFLDINMPKISGIAVAKMLKDSHIIFTTAHREFAVEGFELNALDYLLKPFSFQRFLEAIQKLPSKSKVLVNTKNTVHYIDIKNNKIMQRVPIDKVLYIEGMGNYIKIATVDKNIVTYNKMSEIITHLSSEFHRVHRSYIINSSKITTYSKDFIEINDKHIPIGVTYRKQVMSLISKK